MSLTLAILNGKLWTGAGIPDGANSIGIVNEKIAVVGDIATVRAMCSTSTRVVELDGSSMILPGFTDSHCHFLDGGLRLMSVQLRDVTTPEEFTKRVAAAAAKLAPGTWLLGGDWDHQNWGGALPQRSWIDAVTPHTPVWLNRMDGHMCLANLCAMTSAGVTATTPDVDGGTIERDGEGAPAGVFKDNAMNLVLPHIPRRSDDANRSALEAAMSHVAANGVTEVHTMVTVDCACGLWPPNLGVRADEGDMEAAYEELALYRSAHRDGKLRTRIRAALPLASWKRLRQHMAEVGPDDDWLMVGCLKAMLDGSLGSHTAGFHDAYDDTPGYNGRFIWDPAILEGYVLEASAAGLQVMVHAIGDRAVSEQLNIFERVQRAQPDRDHRFRIEHAQHIAPVDIPRFGSLGVVASMQMSHLADDGRWATAAIGKVRMQSSWPMRSLLATGAVVACGSDWFVTEPCPLEGIYAAVTRRTTDGQFPNGLVPEERVTMEEALRSYTVGGAYAAFEEKKRGTLEVGKLADVVVLDRDLRDISVDDIPKAQVLLTVVGGIVVFSKAKFTHSKI